MANEVVQDADAALTAWLETRMIEEARPTMAALQHCLQTDISGNPTLADKFSLMPAGAVAATVSDGGTISNTGINPTSVTITAGALALGSVLTDLSSKGSILNEAAVIGFFSRGVSEKIDTDITALYPSFTTNTTVGTSGAALTIADFQTSQYELELAKAPGKYVFVGHTMQINHLRQALAASGASLFVNQPNVIVNNVGLESYKGTFLGVDVFSSPTCTTANAAVDVVGGMYTKADQGKGYGAIGFTTKWALMVDMLRTPMQIGVTIAASSAYGTAILKAAYGVKLVTSAT